MQKRSNKREKKELSNGYSSDYPYNQVKSDDDLLEIKKGAKQKNSDNYTDDKVTKKYKRHKRKAAKTGCLGVFVLFMVFRWRRYILGGDNEKEIDNNFNNNT